MTHHMHPSPTIPGLSPIHHPQSPSLMLNGSSYSPSSSLLANVPPSMMTPALAHPTPHKASFSPLGESPALWEAFNALESLQPDTPSAHFGDVNSQFSRLLFNLLPSGNSLPTTPGPIAATPNLDSFIHSPSPMSFPLSSERGMVIPTHSAAGAMPSPSNSTSSYPSGGKTHFLRSLEDFDLGILESYIADCDMDVSLGKFDLPKKDALNRYLCAYFEGMHQHHPFIHTPTFDPATIKGTSPCSADIAPLFLSMCCIGALYCFERDTSRKLHIAVRKLIYFVPPTNI
jgi:Fungal specific transcription factor domain